MWVPSEIGCSWYYAWATFRKVISSIKCWLSGDFCSKLCRYWATIFGDIWKRNKGPVFLRHSVRIKRGEWLLAADAGTGGRRERM